MSDVIDGEAVEEPGTDIVQHHQPVTLFNTDDPAEVLVRAANVAKPLAAAVRGQKLIANIQGREHVLVDGWTLLGSMLGVYPITVWTHKLDDGWEARVEARTRDGAVVGAAEAQCLYTEKTWRTRDDYALRSMAQTRATSKALRQPLGFVMQLAGLDPTPAEEMPAADNGKAISLAQVKRLWVIAKEEGVPEDRMRELMIDICGVDSSKDIPPDSYDALVAAVQAERVPFE